MWNRKGQGAGDNQVTTILEVLKNKAYDFAIFNIGLHQQQLTHIEQPFGELLKMMQNLDELVRSSKGDDLIPIVWISMNSQYAPLKPRGRKYQDFRLSRAFNEFAHWAFESTHPDPVISMFDFTTMIEKGFPWTTRETDGMHSSGLMGILKWHTLLNLMCSGDGQLKTLIPL